VRPGAKGLGVAVAAVGLAHAAPSVTALAMVRRLIPRLAGRGRADHVALTFDDGPDAASTPYFLDLLDELGRGTRSDDQPHRGTGLRPQPRDTHRHTEPACPAWPAKLSSATSPPEPSLGPQASACIASVELDGDGGQAA